MAGLNDVHLIEICLAGNEAAWEVLIERYSRLIYSIPLRFGFSSGVADEIFQETCLILLEKLDTLVDRQRLSSWLVTICRRACIQRWRQKKHYQIGNSFYPNVVNEDEIEKGIVRVEEYHRVHCALNNLAPPCQRLLKALFFKDPPNTYDAIASQLDIPLGSVGPTRKRCLEKLRREIVKLEQQANSFKAEEG
jgi:RNA polymerase sigma factor (sigma-70 family)